MGLLSRRQQGGTAASVGRASGHGRGTAGDRFRVDRGVLLAILSGLEQRRPVGAAIARPEVPVPILWNGEPVTLSDAKRRAQALTDRDAIAVEGWQRIWVEPRPEARRSGSAPTAAAIPPGPRR